MTASERHSDAVICQECDVNVAYDLSDPHPRRACEHLEPICSECWPGSCVPCRLEAEREMYRSGAYSPAADPFVDHTAPPYAPQRVVYLDGSVWRYRDNNDRVED